LTSKSGYGRGFQSGPAAVGNPNTGSIDGFCYFATPTAQNQSGVRGFSGDASGRICFDAAGAVVCAAGSLPATCRIIQ
ncbi:MAG TPA: hypothetical protein VGP61_03140, partial [Gemmatimonadales bacterium]|nr:hypothetical protein [Gemmatimonadales bacterium]